MPEENTPGGLPSASPSAPKTILPKVPDAPEVAHGPAVEVVPATPKRQWSEILATGFIGMSFVVDFLQKSGPDIANLFPRQKWIPSAIGTIGGVWLLIQRYYNTHRKELVNLTTPGGNTK